MRKKVGRRVESYLQESDRILMVRLDSKPVKTVIVQVYMPTSKHSDLGVEVVYSGIENVLGRVKGHENLIITGDFNTVVGEGREGGVLGPFGLGNRNDIGARLIDYCDDRCEQTIPTSCPKAVYLNDARRQREIPNRLYSRQATIQKPSQQL